MENYINNSNSNIAFINKTNLKNLIGEVVEEKLIAFSHWMESKMVDNDRSLSKKETADYLGISISKLDRMRDEGYIKADIVGKNGVFYRMSEIKKAQQGIR